MEACSGSHHWCRKLIALGLDARIIPSQLVSPYRLQGKGGKNDANDAAAVCEAASRPQMHFVPPKTISQQGMLCVHRLREGFKVERTATINRIRGLLCEFGVVLPQSASVLRERLTEVIEDASNDIAGMARMAIERAYQHWQELDAQINWCDQRIAAHNKEDDQVRRASQLKGIGPLTASALVATVGDFKQFRNGAQFGAWLGLVPKQNSSGGRTCLGGITKRGDVYVRMLLIQAARSAVLSAERRSDPISQWVLRLRERSGWQKAAVALANKNARILWAVLAKDERFDPHHVSVYPVAGQQCAIRAA